MGPEVTCLGAIRSAEHQWAPPQLSGLLCPRKTFLCPISQLLDKFLLLLEGMTEQPSVGSSRLGLAPWQWLSGLAQHHPVVWDLRVLSPGHPRKLGLDWKSKHAAYELKRPVKAKTGSCCSKIPLCRQNPGKTCLIWTSTGRQLPTAPESSAGCSPSDVQGIMKFIWMVGTPCHNSDGEILFVLLNR